MLDRRTILACAISALTLSAPAVHAEQIQIFYADDGAAIDGYDTVSYFMGDAPMRGNPEIAVMWKGAVWYFSSHENREAFEANPHAYAPQFGGYCAYAVSRGYTVGTDPMVWQIVDDKLYLVHSSSIEKMWERDVQGNIAMAEDHWPQVLRD
ncbi:hypothetical protein TRM7615_00908 [Falsiruegeria mediterranea M17]|uniref:YHS domain-containing protein n=2 Tax=Falsiruegeria TaxID=2854184 RepID=A0A2R8C4P3_9RHOB|nr:hypothetical protein TRM7615_00908 [Falsiruegeria mediterranea M17]